MGVATHFSQAHTNAHVRCYDRTSSIVFRKTDEVFGGLSNMSSGFPLCVNRIDIRTSEALYQACRFPHHPEVQKLIIDERSPMTAKMKSKPHRWGKTREGWEEGVRVKVMRWCLRVKLAQNFQRFGALLLQTEDRDIIEEKTRADFWGAKPTDDGLLVGMNVLGRLLMELRDELKTTDTDLQVVKPLSIPDFVLFRQPIAEICGTTRADRHASLFQHNSMQV